VWGPLAGYFAEKSSVPLEVTPILADPAEPALPMTWSIGIGVRPQDEALRQKLDHELERLHPRIQELLASYGIPQAMHGGN
jgi:mxaJ protein